MYRCLYCGKFAKKMSASIVVIKKVGTEFTVPRYLFIFNEDPRPFDADIDPQKDSKDLRIQVSFCSTKFMKSFW